MWAMSTNGKQGWKFMLFGQKLSSWWLFWRLLLALSALLLALLQKQPLEVFCEKRCSLKCCKIHRKTPAPESLFFFNKVADLRRAPLIKRRLWHQHIHDKKFSGLSWMIKRYYILDYPENRQYRDKINSLGFHQAVNQEQSNQAREKNAHQTCGEERWLFASC